MKIQIIQKISRIKLAISILSLRSRALPLMAQGKKVVHASLSLSWQIDVIISVFERKPR